MNKVMKISGIWPGSGGGEAGEQGGWERGDQEQASGKGTLCHISSWKFYS